MPTAPPFTSGRPAARGSAAAPGAPPSEDGGSGRALRAAPQGWSPRPALHLCGPQRGCCEGMRGLRKRNKRIPGISKGFRQRVPLLWRAIPETSLQHLSWRELSREKRCCFCPFPKVGFLTPPDFPAARLRAPATISAPQRLLRKAGRGRLSSAPRAPAPSGARQRSPTRRRRPPLRRCSAASQGSWPGAEGLCRTAWRRCGGGGSASWGCRGCAVRRELSQVRVCRASREAGRPLLLPRRAAASSKALLRAARGARPAGTLPDLPLCREAPLSLSALRGRCGPPLPAAAVAATAPAFLRGKAAGGSTRAARPLLSPCVTRGVSPPAWLPTLNHWEKSLALGSGVAWVLWAAVALAALSCWLLC